MSIITTRENKIPVMFPEDVKFKNFEWRPEPIMCPVLIPFWDMANHKNGEISTSRQRWRTLRRANRSLFSTVNGRMPRL